MGRRYDQSELNTYGAEDDDAMDANYRAMDAGEQRESAQRPTRDPCDLPTQCRGRGAHR